MNIYICTIISKKNIRFLNSYLNSLRQLRIPNNCKLKMVFIINPKIYKTKCLIKKLLYKIDYVILKSSKDNIPYSRNTFLKYLKNKNFQYAGFLDDDCIINKNWLLNMINFIGKNNCDIVGGPQKHKVKNKVFLDYYEILEPRRHDSKLINWVATNNCFFSKKVLIKSNIIFDLRLARYGGSDQLFFSELSKKQFKIKWNKSSFITENYNPERESKVWFLKRNLRYGYSGNLIDKKIYGKMGLIIICMKIFYLIFCALLFLVFPNRKNFIKSSFFLSRASGRLIGIFNYKPKKYI